MLIHECIECGDLSINRIAADDDPDSVMEVFNDSLALSRQLLLRCEEQGIMVLNDVERIYIQLYGQTMNTPAFEWN